MDVIKELLIEYGYIVIFGTLFLELIALPLPGEVMMTFTGFLVGEGHLNYYIAVLAAFSGTVIAMTCTYFIGKHLGQPFFVKYGHLVHFGPREMKIAADWFEKYGDGLIVVAYFIPGVRHVTGYFSGLTGLRFKEFAKYAYIGAGIWAVTFITLGRFLGANWEKYEKIFSRYFTIGGVLIAILILIGWRYRKFKHKNDEKEHL